MIKQIITFIAYIKLPSSTSAKMNIMSPEQTYCGTEYGIIMWKLRSIPTHTIISDANKICLQSNQRGKRNHQVMIEKQGR